MKTHKLIKQLREERELTQQEVANALNLNLSVYKKIELGSRPIRETELSNIADFFNVSTDYLLERTNNPHINIPNNEMENAYILHMLLKNSDPKILNISSKLIKLDQEELDVITNLVNLLSKKAQD